MTHELGVKGTDLGLMVTSVGPMVCGLRGGLATHTSADPWPRPAPTPAGATLAPPPHPRGRSDRDRNAADPG